MSSEKEQEAVETTVRRPGRRIVSVPVAPSSTSRSSSRVTSSRGPAPSGAGNPFGSGEPRGDAPKRREPITQKSPERERWEKLTEGIRSIHGRPFDSARVYNEGDVILHKQFGLGIVEKAGEEAIAVLFRDGVESLAVSPEVD